MWNVPNCTVAFGLEVTLGSNQVKLQMVSFYLLRVLTLEQKSVLFGTVVEVNKGSFKGPAQAVVLSL